MNGVESGMPIIIRAAGLARDYHLGNTVVHALAETDLTLAHGEFVALMGPSGCGKTTLLYLLGCLDLPSRGRYWLDGREVSQLSVVQRARLRNTQLGFVFQDFFLLPSLTAWENVALPLLYQRGRRAASERARALEGLAQVGLAERANHRPRELSGGERQRVAIARTLINGPALLLADEPTGNLDSATGAEIMAVLRALWEAGLTILLVTHDAAIAAHAQRTLRMRDGQLLAVESGEAVDVAR